MHGQCIAGEEMSAETHIRAIIRYIGENAEREGLKDTPERVVNSYRELFSGYNKNAEDILKTFSNHDQYDEMVLLRDIQWVSFCEHHMLPFTGKAHIAYIPKDKIVGISKLARLLEVYTRRLQIQERITVQITKAMDTYLNPLGSACVLEASHSCISCRGVGKQNSIMSTSSLTGVFRQPEVRSEFFHLIK